MTVGQLYLLGRCYAVIVALKQKSQVTIPNEILKRLNLNVGDKFEVAEQNGHIVLTPVVVIPKDQAWFYSEAWQRGEAEADRDVEADALNSAQDADELLKGLGLGTE